MKKPLIIRLLLVLAVSTTVMACMTPAKYARKRMNPTVIPADFDPNRHVLLLEDFPQLKNSEARNERVTGKLDKAFKKFYSYRYQIASAKEIRDKNGKYADTSIYKFALLNSLGAYSHGTTTTVTNTTSAGTSSHSVSPSATSIMIDFHFYDRSTGDEYRKTGEPHAHLTGFAHAYADFIELTHKKRTSVAVK
jgi:hypothetical protein